MTAASWMVRAGDREKTALDEQIIFVGWCEVGDLTPFAARDELRDHLREVYTNESAAVLGNWTGQLWRFRTAISIGDLVVLPLKSHWGLAIGRVSGDYEYLPARDCEYPHVRRVEWLITDLDRGAVDDDLLASIGSLLTVCALTRHEAGERIAALAAGEPDPGWSRDGVEAERYDTSEELFEAAQARSEKPLRLTIRDVLHAFSSSRRTGQIVDRIEAALAENGLVARPSIADGWLDSVVSLHPVGTTVDSPETDRVSRSSPAPVGLRVGSLESANRPVVSVHITDPLERALTLMLMHDYSQLAVLDENDNLLGAVSWESIGRARAREPHPSLRAAHVPVRTVSPHEDLLSIINSIYRDEFVFVVETGHPRLLGIVTAADLTLQFGEMARPFALIEEIERRLRRRIDEKLPRGVIEGQAPKWKRASGEVTAADLTLGTYPRLLQSTENFNRLEWVLDQDLLVQQLVRIKNLRNELMHFSTDPLSEADARMLTTFVDMLRTLDPRP